MILGITGGVGAGKSTVLDYLKDFYGACLIECDEVARELQQPGEVCFGPMLELFSGKEDLLNPDGTLNRKTIAALVFAEEEVRESLNRIVHPAVKEDIIRQTSAVRLLFVESAILCEAGLDSLCDKIVVVEAPEAMRIERVIARDYKGDASLENINKVRARVRAQENAYDAIPQQKRLTIINDGQTSIDELVQNLLTNS